MADWLQTLPGADAEPSGDLQASGFEPHHEAGQGDIDKEAKPIDDDDALELLSDFGLGPDEARALLARVGQDIGEAVKVCKTKTSNYTFPDSANKRRRLGMGSRAEGFSDHKLDQETLPQLPEDVFEVEGVLCRRRGRDLVLWLSTMARDGPVVGSVRPSGEIVFNGLNEWMQELLTATIVRGVPDGEPLPLAEDARVRAASTLADGDPWLWDDFAAADEVHSAHVELEELHSKGRLLSRAAQTTAREKGRSDRIVFLDLRAEDGCPPACRALFRRLEAAASQLCWPKQGELLCPKVGMAAVYDGGGARYAPHRDNEIEGGSWINHRSLTAVAYINPKGFADSADGGQLRCFIGAAADDQVGKSAKELLDLPAKGGTAVLFPARKVLHEVLPSYARRYALTLWFLTPPDELVNTIAP